jgi:glucuronate isomerase
MLDDDRLLPADPTTRAIAKALFDSIRRLPIISPHGHTEPRWFAEDQPFPDPAQLLIVPDHYLTRMLASQGHALESLGVPRRDGGPVETDGRKIWHRFASNYHLFRGTPSRLWLNTTLESLFDIDEPLSATTADAVYDRIAERLAQPGYRPRALFERFGIEVLATTDGPLDDLNWHAQIKASGWNGRIIPTYRPDAVVDADRPSFAEDLARFGEVTGCDVSSWDGYLEAHRNRRGYFKSMGATATDHGHPTALTADLGDAEARALYDRIRSGAASRDYRELFRAQMLTEMARMSLDDGLVMQIHAGSWRNHSPAIFDRFGPDKGFDIPRRTDFVGALKPLLDRFGLEPGLTIILFTLDETTFARELAPLAGAYPALRLGPPWWFYDSPEGMMRFRKLATETAGFYNTVGFNDDTRAFPSIPARHDVARRIDCAFLARLVAEHRLSETEAFEVATDLAYRLPKAAYRL